MQPRRRSKKIAKFLVILALMIIVIVTVLTLTSYSWLTVQQGRAYAPPSGEEPRTSGEQPAGSSSQAGTQGRGSNRASLSALPDNNGPSKLPTSGAGGLARTNGSTATDASSGSDNGTSSEVAVKQAQPDASGVKGQENPRGPGVAISSHPEAPLAATGQKDSLAVTRAPSKERRKVIVYECTQNNCGGWADRQKGMVIAYVLATLLGRDFRIYVTTPCPLVNFLRPNKVDWRIEWAEMVKPGVVRVYVIDAAARNFFISLQGNASLEAAFPADVTVMTTNMEGVQFLRLNFLASRVPWIGGQSVEDIYRRALTDLFAPTNVLLDRLKTFNDSIPKGRKLVCAHMRIGSDAISNDVRLFHRHDEFSVLASFLARYNDSSRYRLVVTSDSQKIIELTKAQFPTVVVGNVDGPLAHIDKTSDGSACEGFKRALLEQHILSSCDLLVLSESGFSKVAAFLRGRDDDLFIFRDSVVPCKRVDAYNNTDQW